MIINNTQCKLAKITLLAIAFSSLLTSCASSVESDTSQEKQQSMVEYFTDSAFGNAINDTQYHGEYKDGVTYVTFQGRMEDLYVAAYNHVNKTWQGPFKAGESLLGRDDAHFVDNHGSPSLVVDDEGYIHVAFGGHGGTQALHGNNPLGDYHSGEMKHMVSKKPYDISSWEQLSNIPPFGTYTQFVKMDNGDLYLFYRHGAHRSNWVFQKSTDNGRTFAAPVSVAKTKVRTDTGYHDADAWYGLFKKGPNNQILATFNYHICKSEERHDGERHNAYYMVMDTKDHLWRNAAGKALVTPITKEYADIHSIVANNGKAWAYRGDVTVDSAGNPHVTQYVGEENFQRKGGAKQIRHYRWTGTEWTKGVSRDLPTAKANLVVSSPNKIDLLTSKRNKGGGIVYWWHSVDGGENFKKGETVFELKGQRPLVSSFIRNAHPDAQFMVVGKNSKSDYSTLYLLGENGPVLRNSSEAHHLTETEKNAPKMLRAKKKAK